MGFIPSFYITIILVVAWIATASPIEKGVNAYKVPTFNRAACQAPTYSPLAGCPSGTLLVGPSAQFKTIQSAVASIQNSNRSEVILVLPGNYTEQVNVTRAAPLYILGQTRNVCSRAANTVNVIWKAVAGTGDNAYTSVLTVGPNLNATLTGSGPTGFPVLPDNPFGNVDFRAYNLNFINNFAPYSDGPSLTLSMGYANAGFYYSGFFSYQDTVGIPFTFATSHQPSHKTLPYDHASTNSSRST